MYLGCSTWGSARPGINATVEESLTGNLLESTGCSERKSIEHVVDDGESRAGRTLRNCVHGELVMADTGLLLEALAVGGSELTLIKAQPEGSLVEFDSN